MARIAVAGFQHETNTFAPQRATWADFERAGLEKVKAMPGHEVYTITPAQLDEWKKSAEPLRQKWSDDVKKAGGDPDAIWKDLTATLAQYKASY